jgi:2-dehydro-3-deoxy-D-arabinonate dehydratase
MALWRVRTAGGERLARGPLDAGPGELLDGSLDALLAAGTLDAEATGPVPAGSVVLAPVAGQEVWAAGVTYAASRTARNDESKGEHDFYDRVYDAERPELFFKAAPGRVRGPGGVIGVRADSGWDVPEPELALVISAAGEIVGYTIGNDVSSRSIEGENPLYLPQAKIYRGSCALGPAIVPVAEAPPAEEMEISLTIARDGSDVFQGSTQVALLKRGLGELVSWLYKAMDFPVGAVLLTGTSVIPAVEFTLRGGDQVRIAITGLGELVNTVEVVGESAKRFSKRPNQRTKSAREDRQ